MPRHYRLAFRGAGAALAAALMLVLPSPVSAQDPSAELATAQAKADAVRDDITATKSQLAKADKAAAPKIAAAKRAAKAASAAEEKVDLLADRLASQRDDAKAETEAATAAYEQAKADHEDERSTGLGMAALAALGALGAYAWSRLRGWKRSRRATIAGSGLLAVVFVWGLIAAIGSSAPDEPEFDDETTELAALAGEAPEVSPSPELRAAIQDARPLVAKARRLDAKRAHAVKPANELRSQLANLERTLKPLVEKEADLQKQVELAAQRAEEEAAFKAAAVTIDYDQLIKDPFEYMGDKVIYEGEIFQIQEAFGRSIILLSVTDEGYGFWTDEVWVNAGEIQSAEDDIITVYGTVQGMKSYETQIGGSRFVPKIKAKYIEE